MIIFFSSGWNGVAHFQANGGTLVPYKAILGGISSISPYIGLNNGHYIWYMVYNTIGIYGIYKYMVFTNNRCPFPIGWLINRGV